MLSKEEDGHADTSLKSHEVSPLAFWSSVFLYAVALIILAAWLIQDF